MHDFNTKTVPKNRLRLRFYDLFRTIDSCCHVFRGSVHNTKGSASSHTFPSRKTWKLEPPNQHCIHWIACLGVFSELKKTCFKQKQTFQAIKSHPGVFFLPHQAMPLVQAPHQTVARLLHLQVIHWNLLPPADAEDLEAAQDSMRQPPGACGYMGKKGRPPGFWQQKPGIWVSTQKYPLELEMIWFHLFFFKKPLVVSGLGKFLHSETYSEFSKTTTQTRHFAAPGSFQCPQNAWSTALPRGRSKAGRFDSTKPGGNCFKLLGADATFPVGMILDHGTSITGDRLISNFQGFCHKHQLLKGTKQKNM